MIECNKYNFTKSHSYFFYIDLTKHSKKIEADVDGLPGYSSESPIQFLWYTHSVTSSGKLKSQ